MCRLTQLRGKDKGDRVGISAGGSATIARYDTKGASGGQGGQRSYLLHRGILKNEVDKENLSTGKTHFSQHVVRVLKLHS